VRCVHALRLTLKVAAATLLIYGCATEAERPAPVPTPIPKPAPAPAPKPAPAPIPKPAPAPSPVEPKGEVYPLWYGTNRRPVAAEALKVEFAATRDQQIHYGKVFVEIPDDFLKALRDESWFGRFFKSAETRIKVRPPVPFARARFFDDIRDEWKTVGKNQRIALVYLHGFRTTFTEAAQRAAAIGYQLKIPVTAFFSWPSQGQLAGYLDDRRLVEASEDQIAAFLVEFVRNSRADQVHLIAHSMGNYGLLRAMDRPVMRAAIKKGLRFGQVILAAPDVDREHFLRDADVLTRIAQRVTLYAAADDFALNQSKKLWGGERAGSLPPPTVLPRMDTIDVGAVNLTLLGHAYVGAEIAVLQDIHALLSNNMPPASRYGLHPYQQHWILK
jgi:esterase/lipase superfamily enzyme